jgi:hypothetical protein
MNQTIESKPGPHTWKYPAVAALVSLAMWTACWLYAPLWDVFGVPHLSRMAFADTHAILAASDAKAAGADPYLNHNTYDFMGRPHVYGPWWLELHKLGLSRADRVWLGLTLVLSSLVALVWWLRPRSWGGAMVTVLLAASPPMILSYERANNDLLIFLMFIAAGCLLTRNAAWRSGIATFIIWLAAALKFYPLVALIALAAQGRRWRIVLLGGAGAAGFALVWWLYRADFAQAVTAMPRPESVTNYGLKVIGISYETISPLVGWFIVGVAAGSLFWGVVAWFDRCELDDRLAGFYMAGASAWVFCYVFNTNYAYRAVLLMLPAGVWMRTIRGNRPGAAGAKLAVTGLLVLCWLRAGHMHMGQLTSIFQWRLAAGALGLENGLALGVSIYLSATGAKWLLCRWRESGHHSTPITGQERSTPPLPDRLPS